MQSAIMPTYFSQVDISFDHGKGPWLWDKDGNQYLDSLCGIAVTSLGHAHPAITETICQQAGKLLHTSNTYRIDLQQKLAQELTRISQMEQAFFCNSGSEATESAIKLSRMFARKKNINNPQIIVMENAFHGRTMGSLTASNPRIREGFESLLPGFLRVPFNDADAVRKMVEANPEVVAVMLEPIQGEGGIHVPKPEYLQQLREICDKHDLLLILDEVQTGIGRTGKWFAYQHSGILPDIVTIAKALANGVPIGACLARGKACNLFPAGKHGSTFGGNPLACATALTVLKIMEQEQLPQNAEKMGKYLIDGLREKLLHSAVIDVRGKGLMIGVELDRPCRDLMQFGIKHGLLFNITSNSIVRLLPPLIIDREIADQIIERLDAAIVDFLASQKSN